MRAAAGFSDGDYLIVNALVVAREERAAVDHHVDLVRAGADGLLGLRDLDRGEALSGRKGCPHRRDPNLAAAEVLDSVGDTRRVDADRGHAGDGGVAWLGTDALGAERGHLSGRVDRKSTRLNSSHSSISYAVFCLKKK